MNDGAVMSSGDPSRRVVLRVLHDVDDRGYCVHVQLEPLPDAPIDDVVWAAWQAARRRHPWIIGEDAAEQLKMAKTIALGQVNALMVAGGEVLLLVARHEDLRDERTVHRLREAIIDLRGYVSALHTDPAALALPAMPASSPTLHRRSA